MAVEGVSMASLYAANASTGKTRNDSLGIDDFFKLLAAQLQNQSMYDNVDNTQFITQMAQFTTLSQINELNNTIKSNMAVSLIGRMVSVSAKNSSGVEYLKAGVVEQVSYSEGVPYLYVDGGFYQLADILDIGGTANLQVNEDVPSGNEAVEP